MSIPFHLQDPKEEYETNLNRLQDIKEKRSHRNNLKDECQREMEEILLTSKKQKNYKENNNKDKNLKINNSKNYKSETEIEIPKETNP